MVLFSDMSFVWCIKKSRWALFLHWFQIQMVLFSDMLLLCRPDKDGSLHVLSDPVVLQDICQIETHKKHSEC